MRIIAFYLPQFHTIPENDEWWGEGFTEWVNVKKALPLFNGHKQPRVPFNDNYYNLLDISTLKWQAKIAKEYHIEGFCFYHYWFGGKQLLEKPMEMLLENTDIDLPFCISWANENWTNQWVSNNPRILIKQEYGNKDEWERHFNYLLKFFKDDRYLKIDNKPIVVIYKPENIDCINEMIELWNCMAINNGLNGITWISQMSTKVNEIPSRFEKMNYLLNYEPVCTFIDESKTKNNIISIMKNIIKKAARVIGFELEGKKINKLMQYNYDDIWEKILEKKPNSEKEVPGVFVDWDNTPRKGRKGSLIINASPERFKYYFKKQINRCKNIYNKNFMFIFSWNEWAEGGYLEPDTYNEYGYLEAVKEILEE